MLLRACLSYHLHSVGVPILLCQLGSGDALQSHPCRVCAMVQQHLDHACVPVRRCKHQRGPAVRIHLHHVSLGGQKHLHHVLVPKLRGIHQGRQAVVVRLARRGDPGLEQLADHCHPLVGRGDHYGRHAAVVPLLHICAVLPQDLQHFQMPIRRGEHEGGRPRVVRSVDVRPVAQQGADRFGLPSLAGLHHRRPAIVIYLFDRRPETHKEVDHRQIPLLRGIHHRRDVVCVALVHVRSGLHQGADGVNVPVDDGVDEDRPPVTILAVGVGTHLEQSLNDGTMPIRCRPHKCCDLAVVWFLDVVSGLGQKLDYLQVPVLSGVHDGSVPVAVGQIPGAAPGGSLLQEELDRPQMSGPGRMQHRGGVALAHGEDVRALSHQELHHVCVAHGCSVMQRLADGVIPFGEPPSVSTQLLHEMVVPQLGRSADDPVQGLFEHGIRQLRPGRGPLHQEDRRIPGLQPNGQLQWCCGLLGRCFWFVLGLQLLRHQP
mmetsp:Transcript_147328/g.257444  ORF Transcript_147328/g.257444 Transcript_147328/m.257444 type:complete len:487 (+) Transcript_147328:117-1577(+)